MLKNTYKESSEVLSKTANGRAMLAAIECLDYVFINSVFLADPALDPK